MSRSPASGSLVTVADGHPAVIPVSMAVPGRVRFRVEGLRNHASFAAQLEGRLASHGAVRTARANPVTGSLLVLFDPVRLTPRELMAEVVRTRTRAPGGINGRPGRARAWEASGQGQPAWHALPSGAVIDRLRAAPAWGLSSEEAAARLFAIGANRLPEPAPRSSLAMLWDQVATLPVLLLTGAALMSLASGMAVDAAVIMGVVAINAAVGYATERRVDRIIGALRDMTVPTALVRRNGKEQFVPAATLVPGDLIILKAGYDVPADGRLIEVAGLSVNESALTGESLPVSKSAVAEHPHDTHLAERSNIVHAGTAVSEGSGLAVVTTTGPRTEIGRIRKLIAEAVAPPTPLERQLDRLGRRLVGVSIGFCGVALGLGLVRGVPLLEMLRTSIALAVAAVPEGLPAVATTTLALGMHRMLRRNVLVRRLAAVESLGATTIICVDKTGTLTQNRMTVAAWHLGGRELVDARAGAPAGCPVDPRLERAVTIGVLCNEAQVTRNDDGGFTVNGSGTEGALLEAALQAGLDYRELRRRFPLLSVRPRVEGENWMATVHEGEAGRRLMMVKGAPEEVLCLSASCFDGVGHAAVTPENRQAILEANARMANEGMRVLGLAFKQLAGEAGNGYDGLVWVGLVGLTDPLRDGVREAIAACQGAGIRIVMVTGDQSLTALAIARQLNLVRDGQLQVLEASRLLQDDAHALRGFARDVTVFARVSPAHKYQIVRTLQRDGEVVGMTGDGVNDAPALKAADIGVAMGARGTEVARELADVVLLDDNFASIVGAVEQGRTISTNVRKALRFLLSTNFSEILLTLGGLALGFARPLTAIQLLWINLLSDVLPALALSVEPPDPDVMRQPPRNPADPMLSRRALGEIAGEGALLAATALGAYGLTLARSGPASTVAFSTLTAAQLLHALECRSDTRSGLAGLRGSPALVGAVAGTLALQVAAVTVPPLRRLLGTAPLTGTDWAIVAGGAVLPLLVTELKKGLRTDGAGPTGRAMRSERRPSWQPSV